MALTVIVQSAVGLVVAAGSAAVVGIIRINIGEIRRGVIVAEFVVLLPL